MGLPHFNDRTLERWRRGIAAARPALFHGLRLWVSVSLALFVAFELELDNAYWAGTTAAIVCQPQLGASLRKGWFRLIGTLIGAVAIVLLTACFPQDRGPFLVGLALWIAACAAASTLLRNLPFHAAVLSAITAAVVAYDELGAVGGPNGNAFMLAVTRASEISIGIVAAGLVLTATDFGGVPRRLASLISDLCADIGSRFATALALAGAKFTETRVVRDTIARQVIALDPVIDQAYGESAELRYYASVIRGAVDGLFTALAHWRTTAVMLAQAPREQAQQWADDVEAQLPDELRRVEPDLWLQNPMRLRRSLSVAARRLASLPADTPSLRLLADKTALLLVGLTAALDAVALLVDARGQNAHRARRDKLRFDVPDWLPSLVGAARAFLTILAVELFWIITSWPNGALAIVFAAVGTILFASRPDQAYATGVSFMIGTTLAAVLAAIAKFAVLPQLQTFPAFCLALGAVLVPAGAGTVQPWRTMTFNAMAFYFMPLLAPLNQMTYDIVQFYNAALAIVCGLGVATVSFRLIPPLTPAYRTQRLLTLTLRDLRRGISRPGRRGIRDWDTAGYRRLAVFPDGALLLQRSRLLAAILVGAEIIRLRRFAHRFGVNAELNAALVPLSCGDVAAAIAGFDALDTLVATQGATGALRARARILAISEALTQHADYFATGEA